MRRPIVCRLESPDLPENVRVSEVRLRRNVEFAARCGPALLGGVVVLEGEAGRVAQGDWDAELYRPVRRDATQGLTVRLIPYYAWANRETSQMTVWLPVG